MKAAIVYSSRTGNTLSLGRAIHQALPEINMYPIESVNSSWDYDFYYLGFWVDKGSADPLSLDFWRSLEGKIVAPFGTLGAYPDSSHAHECLRSIEALLDKNHVLPGFLCQGAVSPKLIQWMKTLPLDHPHGPNEERLKRWEDASRHPDERDRSAVVKWALAAMASFSMVNPDSIPQHAKKFSLAKERG